MNDNQITDLVDGENGINQVDSELEVHMQSNYEFQYNEVTGRLFWRPLSAGELKELTEYDLNTIIRLCKKNRINCVKSELIQLLMSDFTPRYNPFYAYLESLPKWDSETDYINKMADTVTTTNQEHWRKCFKKWVVAMVGSLKDENTVNQTAPILSGGQGLGKTTWIGNLVPPELKAYFYSGTINSGSKDSITQLSECILIDMDELENLGKKSIGDLKSQMTRKDIRIRRPYGKVAENLPRRASFIGSINQKEFLKDETGSRRFLCFEIKNISNDAEFKIDNLYAQALSLFDSGFQFWFDGLEIQEVQLSNQQFHALSIESELLIKHFEPATADTATHFLSATEIAHILNDREKMAVNNSTLQHLGKALAAKKFENLSRNNRKVWAVRDKLKLAA